MMIDFAKRAYDHNYKFDPIIRSLLDTDFYKLLMAHHVYETYMDGILVKFTTTNRTKSVELPKCFAYDDLIKQLDHVRSLRFTKDELIWLKGNTFFGEHGIFTSEFISYLEDFTLPPYKVDPSTYVFETEADWIRSSMWEIYVLAIISELRTRSSLAKLSALELDLTYSAAKIDLHTELSYIKNKDPDTKIADFGTRRRHSFLWQEWAVQTASTVLGESFTGTSNVYLAKKHGLEAIGTSSHELPMVYAAYLRSIKCLDEEVIKSQYSVLKDWGDVYDGKIQIILPDAYGTTQFLKNCPKEYLNWTGFRIDSKDPYEAGNEIIKWYEDNNVPCKEKLLIFSDGLHAGDIVYIQRYFKDKIRVSFGWGTHFTNAFICPNRDVAKELRPISLVCKASSVNGHPAIKLSDNNEKSLGDPTETEQYRRIFGTEGISKREIYE